MNFFAKKLFEQAENNFITSQKNLLLLFLLTTFKIVFMEHYEN